MPPAPGHRARREADRLAEPSWTGASSASSISAAPAPSSWTEPRTAGPRDALYVAMGTKEVALCKRRRLGSPRSSTSSARRRTRATRPSRSPSPRPAAVSAMPATANERTIYQIIHPDVCRSCQLVMGMTQLKPGSMWNTMPCARARPPLRDLFLFRPEARCARDPSHGRAARRRGTSSSPTSRRCCRPAGRSIPASAPATMPSSGRWAATTRTTPTWHGRDGRPALRRHGSVRPVRPHRRRHRRQYRPRPGDRRRARRAGAGIVAVGPLGDGRDAGGVPRGRRRLPGRSLPIWRPSSRSSAS